MITILLNLIRCANHYLRSLPHLQVLIGLLGSSLIEHYDGTFPYAELTFIEFGIFYSKGKYHKG